MKLLSKRVLIPAALVAVGVTGYLGYRTALRLAAGFEPTIRAQAIEYLQNRFHSDVKLERLDVSLPKFSAWKLWRDKGKGSIAMVDGVGLVVAPRGRPDLPPLLAVKKFQFQLDLGILMATEKHVQAVQLEGVDIHIPPKGQRSHIHMTPEASADAASSGNPPAATGADVVIDTVEMKNSRLVILPRLANREPLEIVMDSVKMTSAGLHQAMNYEAELHIPKPDGWVHSQGKFGPWNADEPGDSALTGSYVFKNANLGVFKPISGILQSTGEFQGALNELVAKGEAHVPDFRLRNRGRAMPLTTRFEALIDGTNGNTILKPVRARLGTTNFVTSGAILKREKSRRRSIQLKVDVPKGEIGDFLKLAMAGEPFMTGLAALKFDIEVPPLDGKVKEKLILDGTFRIDQGQFTQDKVSSKVEELSQRGQGKPGQLPIGDTLHQLHGAFHMEDEAIQFRELMFAVPGAKIEMTGGYDLSADNLDFHGALSLDAKVSQTQRGWKRWAAKPLDPFFAKNGAGTYLRIQVTGSAKKPSFGLDKSKDKDKAKSQAPKPDNP